MGRKEKMTIAKHVELGEQFKKLNKELCTLTCEVANCTNEKLYRQMSAALKKLNKVRSELDNKLFKDYGYREEIPLTKVYYGDGSLEGE